MTKTLVVAFFYAIANCLAAATPVPITTLVVARQFRVSSAPNGFSLQSVAADNNAMALTFTNKGETTLVRFSWDGRELSSTSVGSRIVAITRTSDGGFAGSGSSAGRTVLQSFDSSGRALTSAENPTAFMNDMATVGSAIYGSAVDRVVEVSTGGSTTLPFTVKGKQTLAALANSLVVIDTIEPRLCLINLTNHQLSMVNLNPAESDGLAYALDSISQRPEDKLTTLRYVTTNQIDRIYVAIAFYKTSSGMPVLELNEHGKILAEFRLLLPPGFYAKAIASRDGELAFINNTGTILVYKL